jgi:peptide/nickel transport system permease protein
MTAVPNVELPVLAEGVPAQRGPFRLALRRVARDRAALLGLVIVTAAAFVAIAAPLVAPSSPLETHFGATLQGPSRTHPLGTDNLGRDELSRVIYGARISLASVTVGALVIMLIGVTAGMLSGYYGGVIDNMIQRVIEILVSFPSLVLALAIAGILGPSIRNVVLAVVAVHWVGYARLVRGMVLSARNQPYVEAGHAVGAGDMWMMFREILPNVVSPIIVLLTLEMGGLLLTISSLSFLGLGAQPPAAEWGNMLNQARPFFQSNPHLMIAPGVAITLTVLGFNLLGDGLRDALDPRASRLVGRARRRRLLVRLPR